MARFDLEKLAEELAAKVRPDFEREIEKARADGYRAGIEAALTVVAEEEIARRDWEETDKASALSVAWDRIRALAAPAAPKEEA